ncbi:MAG: zinc-ribbon domain-containing protein [Candidatus Hodarchaeales archaeon]
MLFCPNCGKETKNAKFCPNCGSPQSSGKASSSYQRKDMAWGDIILLFFPHHIVCLLLRHRARRR